ncbi:Cytochrome P450 [Corchorus olitorius]|uniref:Cytochrome P450 n=1 Tax=Corchorus olitorius TaxID=93759 RepID=A0A1R3JXJ3_9ROSI|nr:Cytochrome P450 [Corchorus olitorius]
MDEIKSNLREIGIIPTVTAVVLILLLSLVVGRRRRKKLPPGRRGWPVLGDSINWYNAVASSHPPGFVEKQVKKYGKIFSCSVFGKWAVVSADPKFNRFVMVNEGKLFQSSYPKSFRDLVGKNGVITVQGEQQRKLHGIASTMMRLDKLKFHFFNHIQTVILNTLQHLHQHHSILLQDVAINLMVNQLLGVTSEAEINEMAQLFSDFVDGCLSLPINLPGFAYHTAMKAREKIISKIYMTIEKCKQEGGASQVGNGMLGRLLMEENLADDVVADFFINLLFAGNETTAKTMLFAVYFLTHNPRALTQLLVIDETLRLGGIAIWLMREAKEDVSYQDFVIPKGCFVVPFLSAVHLDENLYKGAVSFDPWRWMDPKNEEKRNWRNSPFYSPFGGGGFNLRKIECLSFPQLG